MVKNTMNKNHKVWDNMNDRGGRDHLSSVAGMSSFVMFNTGVRPRLQVFVTKRELTQTGNSEQIF